MRPFMRDAGEAVDLPLEEEAELARISGHEEM